jgi:hypothetical protein
MIRITGSTLNKQSINKRVNNSKAFDKAAMNAAQKRLDKAKAELLAQYNEHPVTRELEGGETENNLSGSLGGYGNLFSFMGFSRGSNPAKAVGNFLKSFISLKRRSKKRGNTREYRVKIPSMEDFDFAQMPWEQGNSWVRAVEIGVTNFSYYMDKASKASRSGEGIQINNKLRGRGSSGVPYMTEMLNQFRKKLSR